MLVRGSNEPIEFKRVDRAFYKGIVVKNNDPLSIYRVKVFIPELSNQPLTDWLDKYKSFNMRFPGTNNTNDIWSDTKIYEDIANYLPWAEPCFPLMGEGGPARYNNQNELAVLSDTNYYEGFETNNESPPTLSGGAFSPSWFYENYGTNIGDPFIDPTKYIATNNNPYSFIGRPSKHVNKSKGVFGVPSVGTKVWVFHYSGDINFPVYMGVRHDYREASLINDIDQPDSDDKSLDYPGEFENKIKA